MTPDPDLNDKEGPSVHISSMTSSWFDSQSEWEGRDGEREVPLRLVCGWTMNSWVFGSISLLAKVSPSFCIDAGDGMRPRLHADKGAPQALYTHREPL